MCVYTYTRRTFLNNIAAERSEEGNKFQGAVVKCYLPKTLLHRRRLNAAERSLAAQSARGGDRFGGVEQAADFLLG